MLLHIPDGVHLVMDFVPANLVLVEAPLRQQLGRELHSLASVNVDEADLGLCFERNIVNYRHDAISQNCKRENSK